MIFKTASDLFPNSTKVKVYKDSFTDNLKTPVRKISDYSTSKFNLR